MAYWITSDLHFGHKNILQYNPDTRPYASLDEMQESIISHWNSKVAPGDTVFDLGDFSFHKRWEDTLAIVKQLNGQIIKIQGNHDKRDHWRKIAYNTNKVVKVCDYYELKYNKKIIVMLHYPMVVWNMSHFGTLHAFGHCHGSYAGQGKCVDVGWDAQGKILHMDEFAEIADAKEIYAPSHHKAD